jgi:hypothetical protein
MKSELLDVQELTACRESLYRFFSDCLLRCWACHLPTFPAIWD